MAGAAHMVETGIVAAVAHIAAEAAHIALDIVLGAAHIVLDIAIATVHTLAMGIVAADWYTDPIPPAHTTVEYMDPCLLMYCRNYHKTVHSPHFVSHNLCSTLFQSVGQQEHARRAHTAYKMSYSLKPAYDMLDMQS